MPLNKLALYYHTLKYLKFSQLWFRFVRFLIPLNFFFAPQWSPQPRKFKDKWKQAPFDGEPLVSENPLTFSFLNSQGIIDQKEDWNLATQPKLWLYNLHYHDFLRSKIGGPLKEKILYKWIEQNPWPEGIGWEPYPLSLRIVNWIQYFLRDHDPSCVQLQSLYLQCFSLSKQIEYHLQGNHLFENAKALLFASLYFDTKDSRRWLQKAIKILNTQLIEQILEDGGHFERSPMYHAIILEGLLDIYQLIALSKESVDLETEKQLSKVEQTILHIIPKMLNWLSALSHPDRKIAFFNDSTFEVAITPQSLYQYAESLGFNMPSVEASLVCLEASGFCRAKNENALILADIGSVGPSYIPGHAHAETFCFEFSLKGERLFVNSGISTYTPGRERDYQRGTLAHNTVSIDGENSSQTWSSFRVAKRAKVFDIQTDVQGSQIVFSASHDGYKRLKYGLIHRREWGLSEEKMLIKDSLFGTGIPEVLASFHLHPQWSVLSEEKDIVNLVSSETQNAVWIKFPKEAKVVVESYDYALGFNKKKKGICLRACFAGRVLPYSFESEIGW